MLYINVVYYCILQVPLIYHNVSSVATAPSSFVCCESILATSILSFMHLPIIYMTNIVTSNKIIAVTNTKNIKNKIIIKGTFVRQLWFHIGMPFWETNISFFYCNWSTKSFHVLGAISNLGSNSGGGKEIGKVCL